MAAAANFRLLLNHSSNHAPPARNLEFELLLACCAHALDGDRLEKCVRQRPDWEIFIGLAEHHRVIPQVYQSLAPYSDRLPVRDFSKIRSRYQANARNALWFTGELLRILKHLEDQGIAALPYKGPALAQTLYADVTARQFSDLDILVRPEEVPKAKQALAHLEYKPGLDLSIGQERDFISSGYECSFDGVAGPHLLELKWSILPRFYSIPFDVETLFHRAEHVRLGAHVFPTLSANDLFLVLCVHAAKHLWLQLSWLCDITALARSHRVDWNSVWQQSRQLGIQRIVAVNLRLAHDLLGSPLPEEVETWLEQDRGSATIKSEILQIIRSAEPVDTESPVYFRLTLGLRERRLDQFRFLWRLLWTPSLSEWSLVDLPESLSWIYRGVRLLRLGKRFVALACARPAFFLASERPADSPRSTTFL